MLDASQAFKFGFLLRCAREGLSPDQTRARIALAEKRADFGVETAGKAVGLGLKGLGFGLRGLGWGLAGAAGLGVGGGYLAANMRRRSVDPQEVQRQELIASLNAHIEQVKRRNALRKLRQGRPLPAGYGGRG